jgi:predicted ATPase
MDRVGFRTAVAGYRRPTGHTQQELAGVLGLNPKVLSHKLNGSDGAVLGREEVRRIVGVLADWGALTRQTQAIELLGLMELGPNTFSAADWAIPPLSMLEVDGRASSAPQRASNPASGTLTRRVRLPAELTPLVGRGDEIRQVVERFDDGARLVTLTGAGGIGKTRLALAVAAAMGQRSSDQVRMVALAAVRECELVSVAIAAELGLREAEGGAGIEAVLFEYLRDQQLLLVLDNLEQVLGSALLVAEMLRVAPGLRVLATSRVPLRVYGEHEFRVPPLRLPSRGASELDALASEALALFAQRARAVRADFRPGPAEATVLTEICTRLDGLPLAIELAAAQVRHLPLQVLLDRLGNGLDLHDRRRRDAPGRQRTLRAALDWSYALLTAAQQRMFMRLGVFVSGFTAEAARAVCSDDGEDLEAELWELVDNALLDTVHALDDAPAGAGPQFEPRFGMPETVREYALVRLAESGEAHAVRSRHRDWYVDWAERAAARLTGPDQSIWYRRMALELDNCRAARACCRSDPMCAASEVRMAASWARYFHIRAPGSEAREWLTEALQRDWDAPCAARATLLTWLGQLEYLTGEADSGRRRLAEAVMAARQTGDGRLLALSLRHLALYTGDPILESRLLEEAAAAARAADDGHELALALSYLGAIQEYHGEIATAERFYRDGVAAARRYGDLAGIADGLLRLGRLALTRGECVDAAAAIGEALAFSRTIGYEAYIALAHRQLARVDLARGDFTQARANVYVSLELARQAEPGTEALGPLRTAATVAVDIGNPRLAVRLLAAETAWRTRHPLGTDSSLWARWVLSGQGVEEDVSRARAALGDQEFSSAWAVGSALTLKAALTEACELAPPDVVRDDDPMLQHYCGTSVEPVSTRPTSDPQSLTTSTSNGQFELRTGRCGSGAALYSR